MELLWNEMDKSLKLRQRKVLFCHQVASHIIRHFVKSIYQVLRIFAWTSSPEGQTGDILEPGVKLVQRWI